MTAASTLQLSLDLTWPRRPWTAFDLDGLDVAGRCVALMLPGFDRRPLGRLIVLAEAGDRFAGGSANLDEAIEYAIDRAHAAQLFKPGTLDKYGATWRRFGTYARNAAGVTTVAEMVRSGVATRYLVAPVAGGGQPKARTVESRGSALGTLFRILRDVGLLDTDPLLDVRPPSRGVTETVRPLTTPEVERCRAAAPGTLVATREPAAWALMETGASTGEIGNVRHRDLSLAAALVRVGINTRVERSIPLSGWAVMHLRRLEGSPDDWVLVGSFTSSHDSRRTRATEMVRIVMGRAGVGGPDVSARSVTAWAGRQVFEQTGSIEAAARRLGFASLDATAALIGHQWDRLR